MDSILALKYVTLLATVGFFFTSVRVWINVAKNIGSSQPGCLWSSFAVVSTLVVNVGVGYIYYVALSYLF